MYSRGYRFTKSLHKTISFALGKTVLLLDSGKTYKDEEAKTSFYYREKLVPALEREMGKKSF